MGDRNALQILTVQEGIVSDLAHAFGDLHLSQFAAITESEGADAFYIVTDRHAGEILAPGESGGTDGCYALGDHHICVGAAVVQQNAISDEEAIRVGILTEIIAVLRIMDEECGNW